MRAQRFTGAIYILLSTSLIPTLLAVYVDLATLPSSHDVPPISIDAPQDFFHYECTDSQGNLESCHKGDCKGRLKPPRTHHCFLCDVCRVGFDHHCPWVGNCITLSVMKEFMFMLFLTPVTFLLLAYPLSSLLSSQATVSLHASQADAWAHRVWWDRWLSWLALGGPPGRYIIGTALGYWVLDSSLFTDCGERLGCLIQNPHLRVMVTAVYASGLSIFALGLGLMTARQVHRGQSTVEALKAKKSKHSLICLDSSVHDNTIQTTGAYLRHALPARSRAQRSIMVTLSTERPYDLGPTENWRRIRRLPLFAHRRQQVRPEDMRPRLNPVMLQRMLTEM
ncbi:DHHC palmitoyltransferase-domain-containing protein [Gautieria morchelliformis]|nr:DHHC palmitoyltransferase-domain-containing protein [Gautieria morchelliformis]